MWTTVNAESISSALLFRGCSRISGKTNKLCHSERPVRFGRNYIEVGKYIEQLFPLLGVRFIAINDNYDSAEDRANNNIILPFKNLINDAYCRDISVKIRSHLDVKRRRGEFSAHSQCTATSGERRKTNW